MSGHQKFLTGSRYLGSYNAALNCMEGFGRYTFPDGSEYNGYFKRGKFHGVGRLTLKLPENFTFVGEFDEGKIVKVLDMIYGDGLRLNAQVDRSGLNFEDWLYCKEDNDRRLAREVARGLDPVGKDERIETWQQRDLATTSYDCGEGIYKPSTGFVVNIPPPFHKMRFVGCDKEADWITKNCRKGPSTGGGRPASAKPSEPNCEMGKKILERNLHLMGDVTTCPCNETTDLKECPVILATTDAIEKTSVVEADSESEGVASSLSASTSSFSDNSAEIKDLKIKCEWAVHLLKPLAPEPDSDQDFIVDRMISKTAISRKQKLTTGNSWFCSNDNNECATLMLRNEPDL